MEDSTMGDMSVDSFISPYNSPEKNVLVPSDPPVHEEIYHSNVFVKQQEKCPCSNNLQPSDHVATFPSPAVNSSDCVTEGLMEQKSSLKLVQSVDATEAYNTITDDAAMRGDSIQNRNSHLIASESSLAKNSINPDDSTGNSLLISSPKLQHSDNPVAFNDDHPSPLSTAKNLPLDLPAVSENACSNHITHSIESDRYARENSNVQVKVSDYKLNDENEQALLESLISLSDAQKVRSTSATVLPERSTAASVLPTHTAEESSAQTNDVHYASETTNHTADVPQSPISSTGTSNVHVKVRDYKLNEEEALALQEMLAMTRNGESQEMSNTEMISMSQKMEKEFREMMLSEKLKKKQAIEGPCGVQGIIYPTKR